MSTNDTYAQDLTVLRVIAGQSPDYLIHPDSVAFQVEGLSPDQVSGSLSRLETLGYVRIDEVVGMVYDTEPVMTHEVDDSGAVVLVDDPDGATVPFDNGDGTTKHVPKQVPIPVQAKSPGGEHLFAPKLDATGAPVLIEAKDAAGDPVVLSDGWAVTDTGRAAATPHPAVEDPTASS
jgi:hypothetical protein